MSKNAPHYTTSYFLKKCFEEFTGNKQTVKLSVFPYIFILFFFLLPPFYLLILKFKFRLPSSAKDFFYCLNWGFHNCFYWMHKNTIMCHATCLLQATASLRLSRWDTCSHLQKKKKAKVAAGSCVGQLWCLTVFRTSIAMNAHSQNLISKFKTKSTWKIELKHQECWYKQNQPETLYQHSWCLSSILMSSTCATTPPPVQQRFYLLDKSFTSWTSPLPVGLLFYLSGQNSTHWTTVLPVGHLFYLLDNCTTTTCWTKLNLLDNCSTCWTTVLPTGQNSTCGTSLITVRQKHYLLDNSSTCWPKQILRKPFLWTNHTGMPWHETHWE